MDTETPPHILVVEDDISLAQTLVLGLREAQFEVTLCSDGDLASETMQKQSFDLVVLDLMLPGKTGTELLQEWQSRHTTPVIVLTARTELEDRLQCFELGAIDFLPKPFWLKELIARIQARLRLRHNHPSHTFTWADITVDLDARTILRGGQPLEFKRTELNVLLYLIERKNRAISRDQIADNVLTVAGDPTNPRTVDGYIARIRSKLGKEAGAAFQTVWGVGYRFQPSPAHDATPNKRL